MSPTRDPGTILIICTANVARSPAAEFLLREALGRRAEAPEVVSAGTAPVFDHPIDPLMQRLLAAKSIDASLHRSQRVDSQRLEEATVALTMTTDHRSQLVGLVPTARAKVFTLLEFARLCRDADAGGAIASSPHLTDLVESLHRYRTFGTPPAGPMDVRDPYGRPRWIYRRVFSLLERSTRDIAARLGDLG